MKLTQTSVAVALLAAAAAWLANGAGPFDTKLTSEQRIIHAINRLTLGPRPGDVEQVRRMGVDKWIDLQLHPERIAENPVLEAKLAPVESLKLAAWQIFEKYPQTPPALARLNPPPLMQIVPQDQLRILIDPTRTPEDRRKALDALTPELRKRALTVIPPQSLESSPDLQQEATLARQQEAQARQAEVRRLMPPLMDLVSPDQVRMLNRGTREERLAFLNSLEPEKRRQVVAALPPPALAELPEFRREAMLARQPQQLVGAELTEAKLYRAIYSNRQLEEVLVDFWFNHFNVYNNKSPRPLLTSYERDAIRPNVLGHFKDLLLATARHPAMLYYLDNWQSVSPRDDFPFPPNARRPGLNENYGRELMELHTLGVDGGYTQQDVIAVARCLTGWTVFDPFRIGEFQYNPANHDRKEKVVLGHTIAAGGSEQDGLTVIDILARHPSTAKFISRKLAQRFVADAPPQSLVDQMAKTFTATDGDLRAVMQTMFNSREFFSQGAWRSKVKSPFEMVVSAVRATNADVADAFALAQRVADLGQPLYGKVEPTGYPNTGEMWLNTSGLLGRLNFASAIAAGQIAGVKVDAARFDGKDVSAVALALLGTAALPRTLAALEKGLEGKPSTPAVIAGLVISSPDFQRR